MADLKITALTENTTPVGTDLLPIVDDPSGTALTQKVTVDNLDTYLSSTTKTLTNKTIGDTLSIDGAITQTGTADHITLTPGTSKLVKFSVLEQNYAGTDTYRNNTVVLTGWGNFQGNNGTFIQITITFGLTFSTEPIIFASPAGRKTTASRPTALNTHGEYNGYTVTDAIPQTNSGMQVGYCRCASGAGGTGTLASTAYFAFTWMAIGTL